jgi:tRNA G10  N-methylase Trm11
VTPAFCVVDHDQAFDPTLIDRLGGTVKIGTVVASWAATGTLRELFDHCSADWLAQLVPEGRVEYGVSAYGLKPAAQRQVQRHFLQLKRGLKAIGRNARFVTSNEPALSAVTLVRQGVLKHGREVLVAADGQTVFLALTTAVQDYQAYSQRDFGRPNANPKSGMVPPKLAQIMLNLADVQPDDAVLDPYVGSGTILQEAILMGVREVHGSDADARAVSDSHQNIKWLFKEFPERRATVEILKRNVADRPTRATVIVTEPSLGKPLRGYESASGLNDQLRHLEKLYLGGFRRWAEILPLGGRVVMIWPEFTIQGQVRYPNIEADVARLGFSRQGLLSETASQRLGMSDRYVLRYGRPDAKVRRQIRKWIKGESSL